MESIIDTIEKNIVKDSKKLIYKFVSDTEEVLTYEQFSVKVKAMAAYIQSKTVIGDRVVISYQTGIDFIVAFFACIYAGNIAVPISPVAKKKNDFIITDCHPALCLPDDAPSSLKTYENKWIKPEINDYTIAFLQYTSGSTGAPKGVMVSHGNIINNLELIRRVFRCDENSIVVLWLPPYHDMGLIGGILCPAYFNFFAISISPIKFINDPFLWLTLITQYKASITGGPNFAYQYCVDKITPEEMCSLDLSSLKVAFSGAEPISAKTVNTFCDRFKECGFNAKAMLCCYGLAEATLFVSGGFYDKQKNLIVEAYTLGKGEVKQAEHKSEVRKISLVSCGEPVQEIKIVDPKSQIPCQPHQIGEVWIAGKSVAQGYWNKNKQINNIFNKRIPGDENNYFCSGDLGFIYNKELYITGRIKDVIIINGINYYPNDIEQIAESADSMLRKNSCAAFSIESDDGGAAIGMVFETSQKNLSRHDYESLSKKINKLVAKNLGFPLSTIAFLNQRRILKTTSGKIRRQEIKKGFLEKTLPFKFIYQSNQIQVSHEIASIALTSAEMRVYLLLKEIIIDVLNYSQIQVDEITPEQNLLALGVDSVHFIDLNERVKKAFAIDMAIYELIGCDNLHDLSIAINKKRIANNRGAQ